MLRKDSTATLVEEVPEAPFYIPGTESSTRPRRTLKHGDCFVVLDSHADIGATPGGPDGIFFCDMRHLSLPAGLAKSLSAQQVSPTREPFRGKD